MNDIVERLRAADIGLCDEAADFIETLRAQLALTQGTDCANTAVPPTIPADLEAICAYVREHAYTVVNGAHPLDAPALRRAALQLPYPKDK